MEQAMQKGKSLKNQTVVAETLNSSAVMINMEAIDRELEWLNNIIHLRLSVLEEEGVSPDIPQPKQVNKRSVYGELIARHKLTTHERLLFILAFVPYYHPSFLTRHFREESSGTRIKHPDIGGVIKGQSRHFVPTMQTFQFLLGGTNYAETTKTVVMLRHESVLFKENILKEHAGNRPLDPYNDHEEVLTVATEYVNHLRSGASPQPVFSSAFPAYEVSTAYEWEDVVFSDVTKAQLEPMLEWLKQQEVLSSRSPKWRVKAPILFYGSPGTGKTLTAQLIGKVLGKKVFIIDLSMIVSKYVGETEKNLQKLIDYAEHKDWILFFDEADGLFAKRTKVSSAQDKWANLGTNYLLSRMERFKGIAILATNLKGNLDAAMSRRFKHMIHFPRPNATDREQLWQKLLPPYYEYAEEVDLKRVAMENLTGANISNVILDCAVSAESVQSNRITKEMLIHHISRELQKEDRTLTYLHKPLPTSLPPKQNSTPAAAPHFATAQAEELAASIDATATVPDKEEYKVLLSVPEMHLIRKYRNQNKPQ